MQSSFHFFPGDAKVMSSRLHVRRVDRQEDHRSHRPGSRAPPDRAVRDPALQEKQ